MTIRTILAACLSLVLTTFAASGAGTTAPTISLLADHLEHQWGEDDARQFHWDGTLTAGYDRDKLIINLAGAYDSRTNQTTESEIEVLYGRAISTYLDLEMGLRAEIGHGPREQFALIGMTGEVPFGIGIDVKGALGTDGTALINAEAESELLITQDLILVPTLTLDLASRRDAQLGLASGVTGMGAELRLLYVVEPEFTPYIGIASSHALGGTRSIVRNAGDDPDEAKAFAGIRLFF